MRLLADHLNKLVWQLSYRVFFLMIRRPPRSTLDRSSAASDVYKRQGIEPDLDDALRGKAARALEHVLEGSAAQVLHGHAVSYTHLRAHETVLDLVCRLLLENKS